MKEHLVELIFEEYKQICICVDLLTKGIDLEGFRVNNLDIVISLIGFPNDNSLEYDWDSIEGLPHNPKNGKIVDENLFVRDWLYDPYIELMDSIEKIQSFEVTKRGLVVKAQNDEILVKGKLHKYVDWLMQEYDKHRSKS